MSVCDQFPPPFTSRRRVAAGMTTGVTTSDNKIANRSQKGTQKRFVVSFQVGGEREREIFFTLYNLRVFVVTCCHSCCHYS